MLGMALLAPLPVLATEIGRAAQPSTSTLITAASIRPRIEIPCTACGTQWQLTPRFTPQLSAPAPRVRLTDYRQPAVARPAARPREEALRELRFRDNQPLVNRLKRLQALPFVTLWDSTAATLYFGVNRDGEPGVHLRQKKHDRGTLMPAGRTLFVDAASAHSTGRAAAPR